MTTGDRTRDHLPPTVDRLLRDAGLDRHELGGIAVSEGPGGFTGLRVSVAFAMGVAEALGIPVLGVASAAVAASSTLADDDPRAAIVVMATKRGTAWVEMVGLDLATGRRCSRGGRIADATSAADLWRPGAVLLADARQDPDVLATLSAGGMPATPPRFSAAALVRLAERTPCEEWMDPTELSVRYPRAPEAVTLWNARRAAR